MTAVPLVKVHFFRFRTYIVRHSADVGFHAESYSALFLKLTWIHHFLAISLQHALQCGLLSSQRGVAFMRTPICRLIMTFKRSRTSGVNLHILRDSPLPPTFYLHGAVYFFNSVSSGIFGWSLGSLDALPAKSGLCNCRCQVLGVGACPPAQCKHNLRLFVFQTFLYHFFPCFSPKKIAVNATTATQHGSYQQHGIAVDQGIFWK